MVIYRKKNNDKTVYPKHLNNQHSPRKGSFREFIKLISDRIFTHIILRSRCALFASLFLLVDSDAEIEYLFNQIDRDRNGKITKRELRAFFKKNDGSQTNAELTNYLKKMDKNGDGKLDLAELKEALGHH
ncbi:hypothetical protein FGIG_03414 [Fasciola gigantica]|uniref:EF-hand domain-containing protein n=1 Tax=Fasciola gigantica TaxID=46835 RepID=A0A504Y9K4_FASGI|nr:hypothetical protein FGIG_03414 [Fasciola gigantica]